MADTLVAQGIAQTSRIFREISGNNEAGPLESSCPTASRTMCCPQMHPLTLTTAAAVGLTCDVCSCAIKSGEAIYSCAPCDFDACDCCGGNRDDPTVTYSSRAAVAPSFEPLPKDLTTEVEGAPCAEASPLTDTPPPPAKRPPAFAQEEALCECEEGGKLLFQWLRAERWEAGSVVGATSLVALLSARSLYATCLPMMDGAYLAKMLFDPRHHSLVCIASDGGLGTVAAALTFRLVANQTGGTAGAAGSFAGFAELELCGVQPGLQVGGIGSRLVSHFKREMAARGVLRLVTTADNYAIGFWAQQGFTPTAEVAGVGSYDGGILMACQLSEAIPYTRMPQVVRACHRLLLRSWEPEEAPPGGQLGGAGPRSLGSDSSPFPFDWAAGLDRSLPRMAGASRRLFADATSQAHEALSPAVLWRAGTTLPQSPAAALRMLTERTERGMYGTREHVLADIHRLGIGCFAAGGAMRAALEAAEVPAERCVVLPPGSLPRKEDAGNIAELLSCMCAPVHASAPHATAHPAAPSPGTDGCACGALCPQLHTRPADGRAARGEGYD